jgi:two-component system response regulator FlrC
LPHILIVDDERAIRALLLRSFDRAGFEVTLAESAVAAMTLCGSKTFDAVLSDVDMPGINGHVLIGWVAEHHPEMRSLLMSGFGNACQDCPKRGGCILLRKPFSPKEAVAAVTRLLLNPPV